MEIKKIDSETIEITTEQKQLIKKDKILEWIAFFEAKLAEHNQMLDALK